MMAGDAMTRVMAAVDGLLAHAETTLGLEPADRAWARNRLLDVLGLDSYEPAAGPDLAEGGAVRSAAGPTDGSRAEQLMTALADAAADAGLIGTEARGDLMDAAMGVLMPRPSALQTRFAADEREQDGMAAMRRFYDVCVDGGYVRRAQLLRNPRFDSHGLTVTINLTKPEFKTMAKAAAGNAVGGGYPRCTICAENEGYAGRGKRTLRTIPMRLGGEDWFWQFSPYGYFDQHGICVNRRHIPMHVDRNTFAHLTEFTARFPGYFLGCNAALPRIGGSVLAHDHYQGGGEVLPMFRAGAAGTPLRLASHPGAGVEVLDWPGTAMRVTATDRDELIEVCDTIRLAWEQYDDAAAGIASHDADGNRQSAVSPTAMRTADGWTMTLILRNNAVNEEFPEGVFHAHPEYWPVKQEPIGLIEAMGLFILPGRLVRQLGLIEDALADGRDLPGEVADFALEWQELTSMLDGGRDRGAIRAAVRDELGSVCHRILGNTAVFKRPGQTLGFLESIGFASEG